MMFGVRGTITVTHCVGSTVNLASRIEGASEPDRITVGKTVHDSLKDDEDFVFEPRGFVKLKGHTPQSCFFVSSSTGWIPLKH